MTETETITPFQMLGVYQAAMRLESALDKQHAADLLEGRYDQAMTDLIKALNADDPSIGMTTDMVAERLNFIKYTLATQVNQKFEASERQLRNLQKDTQALRVSNAILESKLNQQPHDLGTVDQIASKYNLSKSHVRRLKAEGGNVLADYVATLDKPEAPPNV